MENFYNLKADKVFEIIKSQAGGLSSEEAKKRLLENGENVLASEAPYSRLKVFLSQFKSPLIYILLGAGVVSFFVGDRIDTQVILAASSIAL